MCQTNNYSLQLLKYVKSSKTLTSNKAVDVIVHTKFARLKISIKKRNTFTIQEYLISMKFKLRSILACL